MASKLLIGATVAVLGLGSLAAADSYARGGHCDSEGYGKHGGGHPGGMMFGGGHGNFYERMQERLGLSDSQVDRIDEIIDSQRQQMRDNQRQMRDNRKALFALDPTSENYSAEVDRLAQQASDAVEQMIKLRAEAQRQIATVLDAEQLEKAKALKAEMGKRWGKRWRHQQAEEE